jgi:hypothetical protein
MLAVAKNDHYQADHRANECLYDQETATPPTEAVQPTAAEATEVATAPADNTPEATAVVASPELGEVVAAEMSEEAC